MSKFTDGLEIVKKDLHKNPRQQEVLDQLMVEAELLYEEGLASTPGDHSFYRAFASVARKHAQLSQMLRKAGSRTRFPAESTEYSVFKTAIENLPGWPAAWGMLADIDCERKNFDSSLSHVKLGIEKATSTDGLSMLLLEYVGMTSLWGLVQGRRRYGEQVVPPSTGALDAIRSIERDWNELERLLPQNEQLVDGRERIPEYQEIVTELRCAVVQALVFSGALKKRLPLECLSDLRYDGLCAIARVHAFRFEPYQPATALSLVGITDCSVPLTSLVGLELDLALQSIFMYVDPEPRLMRAQKEMYAAGIPGQVMTIINALWSVGHHDKALRELFSEQERTYAQVDGILERYETQLAQSFPSEEMRWEVQSPTSEPHWALWNSKGDLVGLTEHCIELLNLDLLMSPDPAYAWRTIQRAVWHLPWLGRLLVSQKGFQDWAWLKGMSHSWATNSHLIQVDQLMAIGQVEEPVRRLAEQLVKLVSVRFADELIGNLERVVGRHVWTWLDSESQRFLLAAEEFHRRTAASIWEEQGVRDYAGVFLCYGKAVETTFTRLKYGKVQDRNDGLADLRDYFDKLQNDQAYPPAVRKWAGIVRARLELIRDKRNDATHRHIMRMDTYDKLRGEILGIQGNEPRHVSLFWYAYALDSMLRPDKG